MPKAPPHLGPLEQRVMDLLWDQAPRSVRDVAESLDEPLAYTTVMTTLDRLFRKGLLSRDKAGQAFVYAPVLSRAELDRRTLTATVETLLRRSGTPVLAAFVDTVARIDEGNLAELERLIAERKKGCTR